MPRPSAKPSLQTLIQGVSQESQPAGIVERVDARIRELEQLPPRQSGLLWGEKSSTEYSMNGVRFHYDGLEGQKTGAFLDQRENYAAAAAIRARRGARRFLLPGRVCPASGCEVFERYRGRQFAAGAGNGGEECGLSASNNGRELEWIEANAFDLLREYSAANRRYDTIVLDPSAFAKTKRDLDKALRGYKELNLRAMKMLRPGRDSRHLLLLVSRQRRGLPQSRRRCRAGRPQIAARYGEPRGGQGPSNPAECAGNQLS